MPNSDSKNTKIIWIAMAALFFLLICIFIFFPLLRNELHAVSPEAVKEKKIIDKILKTNREALPIPEDFDVQFEETEKGSFKSFGGARDSDIERLANSKTVRKLELRVCELTGRGVLALSREPLSELILFRPILTADAVRAFGQLKFLSNLDIRGTQDLSDDLLSNLNGPPSVVAVDFSDTRIASKTLEKLGDIYPILNRLTLRTCKNIDAAALKHLQKMDKLSYLELSNVILDKASILEIVKLKKLDTLEVSKCRIYDDIALPLSRSSITTLNIARNPITDKSLVVFSGMKKLEKLNANLCKNLSPGSIKRFRKLRPGVSASFMMKEKKKELTGAKKDLVDIFFAGKKMKKKK